MIDEKLLEWHNKSKWFLYFVIAEEVKRVKIGITTDLYKRLSNLQTSCPVDLSIYAIIGLVGRSEAFRREGEIHKVFTPYLHRREWFNFTEACKSEIDNQIQLSGKYGVFMSGVERYSNPLLEKTLAISEEPEFVIED